MKIKSLFVFLAIFGLIHNISFAQDMVNSNPYAIFGGNPYIAGAKIAGGSLKVLVIENIRDNSPIARLEHNLETGIVTAFDNEGIVILQKKLREGERAWPTQDRFAEKYYRLSPYSYGAGNPINIIDINGDSITVLNLGFGKDQHMGMLIQNDTGKWQYFSVNGDNVYNATGGIVGGRAFDDLAIGFFDNPQQFLDSRYNQSNGKEGKGDTSINSYGYSEGYILPTTPEQDNTIRSTFTDISVNEDYNIISNNCATVVQRSLNSAGIRTATIKTQTDAFLPTPPKAYNPWLPSEAFRAIRTNNPNGIYINRR